MSGRLSIAHGLFTWQDGRAALEPCLRSTAGHVDHVIIADGRIDGVPNEHELPDNSDLSWLADRSLDWLPERIPISSRSSVPGLAPWPTLSSACTWILNAARRLEVDWLLFVDSDQELHNGQHLRTWLGVQERYSVGDAFPIRRAERRGAMYCPWQCVRVDAFERYLAGCYILEHRSEGPVTLVPPGPLDQRIMPQWSSSAPWLSHHPERRPPWRQAVRLGSLETALEPPPDVPLLRSLADLL